MGALGNLTGLALPAVGVAEAVAAAGELGALLLAAAPCAGAAPFSRSWRAAGYYTENHKAAGQHVKYRTSNTEGRKAEAEGVVRYRWWICPSAPPPPLAATASGKCPRCGRGHRWGDG